MLCLVLAKSTGMSRPLFALILKSYVKAHVRTLKDGRQVHVPSYFTKRVPKPKEQPKGRQRAVKQEPPKGVYQPQTPEQLAHRLVRHVQEGTMTHEEALANILHLEERAGRGEGLTHAGGHQWTAAHLKEFGHHARTKLLEHLTEQKRKQSDKAEQERQAQEKEKQEREKKDKRNEQRREKRAQEKDAQQAQRQNQWKGQPSAEVQAQIETVNAFSMALRQSGKPWRDALQEPNEAGARLRELRAQSNDVMDRIDTWPVITKDPDTIDARYPGMGYESGRAQILQAPDGTHLLLQLHGVSAQLTPLRDLEATREARAAERKSPPVYADIHDTQTRLPAEAKATAQHFRHAQPYIQAATRKARALREINPPGDTAQGYFNKGQQRIVYRGFKGYAGSAAVVYRHEYGHHIDSEIGGMQGYGSYRERGHMGQDREALMATRRSFGPGEEVAEINQRMLAFARAAMRAGVHPNDIASTSPSWEEQGLSPADIKALIGTAATHMPLEKHAKLQIAWEQKDAQRFFGGLPPTVQAMMLQDYIGAVTWNQIRLASQHSDAYYGATDRYTENHCTEAYANWVSCHAHPDPVWRKMLAHFTPHTDQAFKEMTDQWLKQPTTS